MVWGTEKEHGQLDQLGKQLAKETGADEPRQMIVYDLEDVVAAEAQRLIGQVVGTVEYITGQSPKELTIWASSEQHEQIKTLLEPW